MSKKEFFILSINESFEEIVQINRKYDCNPTVERSPEDKARSCELWDRIHKIEEEWDRTYPAEPCPECGSPRYASIDDGKTCIKIGKCKAAPYAGG